MRIQMRLSREGRIVLEELKLDYLINGETKTSGEIIDEIFESFRVEIYDIDWSLVLNNPEYDGVLADYTSVNPTTLNLNQDTINTMDEFKEFFNQKLGMKRTVYRSFIIRIILKAFRLQKDGINIHIR
ncbi:hypothetical protein [Dellaglioa algida]|uniref:hypothetical protein n=1 Tax=Dellaglioa algida TaxID=105612 RepID=UPI000BD26407|nr:hypothetical protein [Dellaglioa algida]MDK1718319.1 hypothetical protein [Dellaglioa algida]MDK1728104.1 hypothetical protein [Dellaglioa algida]MDK1729589.1 hypothetical protein [Dellaglioa algida]MDK1735756.1 hypothetical protein [Dellaglioa algida]MDK1737435.1 hypothetical protein [Dellaglioa algida]